MLIILDVVIIFLVALRSVLFPYTFFLFYITGTDSAKYNTQALLGTDLWFNQRQKLGGDWRAVGREKPE